MMTSEISSDRKPDGYSFAGGRRRLTEMEMLEKYSDCTGQCQANASADDV
jgi:hypothetical protein